MRILLLPVVPVLLGLVVLVTSPGFWTILRRLLRPLGPELLAFFLD
jgi:hypothetical protein